MDAFAGKNRNQNRMKIPATIFNRHGGGPEVKQQTVRNMKASYKTVFRKSDGTCILT